MSILGDQLRALATRADKDQPPPNDHAHNFERTGWLLLRTAAALITNGDRARALAADWSSRGYTAGADTPVTNSGGDTTSVEAAADNTDHWEQTGILLDLERRLLDDNARAIESRIHTTIRIRDNEGRRTSIIDCANPKCENTITGIGDDRPRRGRCPRCYKHLTRHGIDWPARAHLDGLDEPSHEHPLSPGA